jgi:hypothetical protein
VHVHRRAGEIERVLLCPNCETLRTQVLSLDGYLLRNWYLCPEQQLDSEAETYVRALTPGSGHGICGYAASGSVAGVWFLS